MMHWPFVLRGTLDDAERSVRVMRIEVECLRQGRAESEATKAAALEDAHREIEHLRVDLLEARRTAKSAEVANRELMDTIRAHQSLGSIVAQFKPMLQRIAQAQPKPVKAAPRRAKQKGGVS